MKTFFKTRYYPVNIDKKEIINLPFKRERNIFIMFRHLGFIGIKGHRLNEFKCYQQFSVETHWKQPIPKEAPDENL